MDYAKLGVGTSCSLVSGVELRDWCTTVVVACIYEPGGACQPYTLIFTGCQQVCWELTDADEAHDPLTNLLGISLGVEGCREPAVLALEVGELSILYNRYTVQISEQDADATSA